MSRSITIIFNANTISGVSECLLIIQWLVEITLFFLYFENVFYLVIYFKSENYLKYFKIINQSFYLP